MSASLVGRAAHSRAGRGADVREHGDCGHQRATTETEEITELLTRHTQTLEASRESRSLLTINGGSSSIKFAVFEAGDSLQRILDGKVEERRNVANARVISTETSRVVVRVMHTDAEAMIAKSVCQVSDIPTEKEHGHEYENA